MSLQEAQHEFIELFTLDAEEFPGSYKELVRAQPGLWAMRIIAGLDEKEVRSILANLKAERKTVKALAVTPR